jgi:hypothetical protein
MLGNEGQAAAQVQMLAAVSAANTAAGTITPTIEDATDGSGTGAATVTPNEGAFTQVTTSNDPLQEKRTINASAVRGWIRYVGTIVTGPALVGVSLLARPKNI